MAAIGIDFTFTRRDLASLNKRLDALIKRTSDLGPYFDDASSYMVNVVRNRILRTKKDPSGSRWESLSELTQDLKGHGRILFETGNLARSIHVDSQDPSGFIIAADTGIAPYASYMQRGVARTGGRWPGKKIPARPFMGISDQNVKIISKMLKDHIGGRKSGDVYAE